MDYNDAKKQVESLFETKGTGLAQMFDQVIGPLSRSRQQGGLYSDTPSGAYEQMRETYVKALLLQQHASSLVQSLKPAMADELTRMHSMQTNYVIDEHGQAKSEQGDFPVGKTFAHKIIQELERDIAKRYKAVSAPAIP